MNDLFIFPTAERRCLEIEEWLQGQSPLLRPIAEQWLNFLRDCGDDVGELMHDGHPVLCVSEAAFAYVAAFKAHVNVGFYRGAELEDANNLLEGSGKLMRHIKLRPGVQVNEQSLEALLKAAYSDMEQCLG
ncbi:MAG: hypothetical protein DHS20C12_15710 [Pseudohongiella sp.]|nr:MAG: hypothetical protein DHS20C12_15710 [Pseudohongiella sp.]